jgi:hypothetical protein
MSNLDEPNGGTPGSGDENSPIEKMSRLALEARIRELEKENAHLTTQLREAEVARAKARELLEAMIRNDLPQDEEEYRDLVANSSPLSDLLREMEAKYGLESPK